MDRFRQKAKKDKPIKYADKEKPAMFITDVKSIKENLKIKEILRTVKMNSSMRIKAPRGSKVMQNKDFNDNDDCEDLQNTEIGDSVNADPSSSVITPNEINDNLEIVEVTNDTCIKSNENQLEMVTKNTSQTNSATNITSLTEGEIELCETSNMGSKDSDTLIENGAAIKIVPMTTFDECPRVKTRERKFSLDHTMLTRRQSLSQSEMDLNSIGKSPLERKSSFFRKKMDSFLKNTTKIFKKQSLAENPPCVVRRGSMSISLQSLNDKNCSPTCSAEVLNNQGSTMSLQSSREACQSASSISVSQSEHERLSPTPGDQESVADGVLSEGLDTGSVNSLNDYAEQQGLLNTRAISMSSGLDNAAKRRRRKTSWANRVSWLANETMTNYLRRVISDDYSKQMPHCHSYQDLSSIPENKLHGPDTDSKGRRLSYQRAVSGEDPVLPARYQDISTRRRPQIPEDSEADNELSILLGEFTRSGVPPLKGFCIADIADEAFMRLVWAERIENLEELYEWKRLPQNEEARQAVIRELVNTEADYIRHLIAIVEVFIASAHALQDSGKLLEVDTERLFSNIPDVLNASLYFWEGTIFPMLIDAVRKLAPFNTELMTPGFMRFREQFQPYEKYVCGQTKALDYLRSLSPNAEFMMYLTWCHGQKTCNRLQLSDMLVKPMQRLTKYALILRRIIAHTDAQPERTSLMAMESCSKNYVLDLNRVIRQKEELEKLDALANSLDTYELEFKDDELDKYFRAYSQLNLRAPMIGCVPNHSRCLIHQGDLRYKDHYNLKEARVQFTIEVRVFLLTDMVLICKKLSKGSSSQFKIIRPKFMIDKLLMFAKYKEKGKDLLSLIFIIVDDVGSASYGFALSETPKDPNSPGALKLWESKVKEAKLSYDLGVWYAKNPSRDLSEVELDSSSEYALSGGSGKPSSEDLHIEREARERVAAMLHRSMGHSTEYDYSQASMNTDSFDAGEASGSGVRPSHNLRHPMHRNSTGGSSRNSRLSSFQQSTSAASHDEPQPGPSRQCQTYRATSSVERVLPSFHSEDGTAVQSTITVNVVSESESETMVPEAQQEGQASSNTKLTPRSPVSTSSHNTLRVQPQCVMALVHSLPDLTIDPSPPRNQQAPMPQSASEKLYQSHQELLQRNRLSASHHHQYLTPDHRGTSYPPPSPTRASLKRGLAFSYSFKNPPLSKMGHVNSQSQLQAEAGPSTSQPSKSDKNSPMHATPSTSNDKGEKKKHVRTRNKSGGSTSPARKEDKSD